MYSHFWVLLIKTPHTTLAVFCPILQQNGKDLDERRATGQKGLGPRVTACSKAPSDWHWTVT